MHLYKKITALFMAAAMSFTAGIPVYAEEDGNKEFDEFLREEFVEMMESDYLSLHYTLKNPSAYGIEMPEAAVSSGEIDDYAGAIEEAEQSLAALESFDYESLSDTQKHDYDTYKTALESTIELNTYENFDWYFSPAESILDNLTTNFTEFVFREEQDFEDYLNVLRSVPAYLDEALELTKKQAEAGYFITDAALDDTLDAIEKFCAKTEDNELIVLFEESVDAFHDLGEQRKDELKVENRDIILNEYIPAYEKCAEELEKLRGSRTTQGGLCELEGGQDYYRALVRAKTSASASVEELVDLCVEFLNQEVEEYIDVIYSKDYDESEVVSMTDPAEILDYLNSSLENYPEINDVSYTAKYLDPSVANDSILAYYLNPPIDDMEENQIKINGETIGDDPNELFMTLSHEGMPGHLYQTNYYLSTNPNEIRTQLNMIGYSEGWAMYAETEAFEYSGLSETMISCYVIDTSLNYVLDAVVDLGVNGLGWTISDIEDLLDQLGFTTSFASSLYDYVCENPGVILPYGVGLAEFRDIRAEAEFKLGDSFDLKAFNTVLLENGDRTFESVREDVNAWIETSGGSSSRTNGTSGWLVYVVAALIGCTAVFALIFALRARRKDPFRES